jgi:hypothetical protein
MLSSEEKSNGAEILYCEECGKGIDSEEALAIPEWKNGACPECNAEREEHECECGARAARADMLLCEECGIAICPECAMLEPNGVGVFCPDCVPSEAEALAERARAESILQNRIVNLLRPGAEVEGALLAESSDSCESRECALLDIWGGETESEYWRVWVWRKNPGFPCDKI